MKFIVACLLVLGAPLLPAAVVNGHGYTRLPDWAEANGLRLMRTGRGDEFIVTNRLTRLVFDKDSRTAEVNGIHVALGFPVAVDQGQAWVAQVDLARTIEPLIFASPVSGRKILTICLDPGHGGKDPGNRYGWHNEKTATLALALELGRQLVAAGFNVIFTRTTDVYVDLAARPDLANRRNADLFVSLHFNATETGRSEVQGPETYCITPVGAASTNARGEGADYGPTSANRVETRSLLLAYQVQKSLVRNLGVEDRSVRRARFAVLRDASMPAILIEGGYMTHPVEGKRIFDAGYRRQLAAAVSKGILNYQKIMASPPLSSGGGTNRITKPKSAR